MIWCIGTRKRRATLPLRRCTRRWCTPTRCEDPKPHAWGMCASIHRSCLLIHLWMEKGDLTAKKMCKTLVHPSPSHVGLFFFFFITLKPRIA